MDTSEADTITSRSNKCVEADIVKFIFDLSKELNIEDTQGVIGNELELIALVRNCPFLYDKSQSDFRAVGKKTAAWNAIAAVMHTSVHEVCQRWRSLREGYNKYKKEIETAEQDGLTNVRAWEFYEDMKFIDPHIKHRRSVFARSSTLTSSDDGDETNFKGKISDPLDSITIERHTDILHLISCIRRRPVLYDSKFPDYKNKQSKQDAWNEVAQIVGASVCECEMKWKTLRERFGRERKYRNANMERKEWEYFDALTFMDSHIKPRSHSIFRPILPKSVPSDVKPVITTIEVITTIPSGEDNIVVDSSEVLNSAPITYLINKDDKSDAKQKTCDLSEIDSNDMQTFHFVEATDQVSPKSGSSTPSDIKLNLRTPSPHSTMGHDEDDLFGQTITAELRRLPSGKKKMKIKAEIYKILYDNESE